MQYKRHFWIIWLIQNTDSFRNATAVLLGDMQRFFFWNLFHCWNKNKITGNIDRKWTCLDYWTVVWKHYNTLDAVVLHTCIEWAASSVRSGVSTLCINTRSFENHHVWVHSSSPALSSLVTLHLINSQVLAKPRLNFLWPRLNTSSSRFWFLISCLLHLPLHYP